MSKQNCAQECVMKKTSIGGQALIEGVMMRGPQRTAMAVRHTSGEIRMEEWDNPKSKLPAFCKWPIIRGLFAQGAAWFTGKIGMLLSWIQGGSLRAYSFIIGLGVIVVIFILAYTFPSL